MKNKRIKSGLNLGLSILLTCSLCYGLGHSFGPLPALAPVIEPKTGVWTSGNRSEQLPKSETLTLPGLVKKVQVVYEADGTPHIQAKTDHDAWMAIGYLHAKYRLFQMDLYRRQGEGLLSEILGEDALTTDEFQRQLGLRQTAENEWKAIQPGSEEQVMLESYAEGVNAVIDSDKKSGQWPLMMKMLGYEPAPWTPQDSLVLKGVLDQMMSLSYDPLQYSLWSKSLGYDQTMQLFPVQEPSLQRPYDTETYHKDALAPMPLSAEQLFMQQPTDTKTVPKQATASVSANDSATVMSLLDVFNLLPPTAKHHDENSNAWVVDGTKTRSGKPMLAGDPHLDLTTPAIWYQLDLTSPGYQYAGVTLPGIPLAIIGHNPNISWSVTNGQEQQTYYYQEKTDVAHPNQYEWQGAWHSFRTRTETIPVKGGSAHTLVIQSSVHGPIVQKAGLTVAIDWLGAIPSTALQDLMQVAKAKNYTDFQNALKRWQSPLMNFAYADKQGNIAVLSPGYYPVFDASAKPWLPMTGTGEDDIRGTIPFADTPQSVNPPNHVIATANQRPVSADYPYYIGNSLDFDFGYRAKREYEVLASKSKLTTDDFARLQNDVTDQVAQELVPVLLQSLGKTSLNEQEKMVASKLAQWDDRMEANSTSAVVWYTFWDRYLHDTFDPWWTSGHVPDQKYPSLAISTELSPLTQDLETWTLQDKQNAFFNNPVTHVKRDATTVMIQAYHDTVASLQKKWGSDSSKWTWGRMHTGTLASLAQIDALGYGPRAINGDVITVDSTPDVQSSFGPSWRMISDLGTGQTYGIYPGGQSENPLSPWYLNRVEDWWTGQYRPMIRFDQAAKETGSIQWTLQP